MFNFAPQNVIYNFYSPNENECINPNVLSRSSSWNQYRNLGMPKKELSLPFINSFGDTPDRNIQRPPVFFRKNLPPVPPLPQNTTPKPNTTLSPEIRRECFQSIIQIVGPRMLVKDLRTLGIIFGNLSNITFHRSLTKALILQWFYTNWPELKKHLNQAIEQYNQV